MQNKTKKIILTGDRPTGKLHLGHLIGSLTNRIKLQDEYEQNIMIADTQALTDNFKTPEKVRQNILEVLLDYLAVGIDPQKTTIFVQSLVPQLPEITMYYLNLVTVPRLERNPTIKEEIKLRKFSEGIPAGFLVYPVSQASDITAFDADLVPVGEDQLPLLEQCNEIVRKFNSIYGKTLKEPKVLLSKTPRLIGTDGKNKMSKSLGNTIYLDDNDDIIYSKVMSMYTDPNHIHVNDPGKIEGNTVFTYLDAFCNDMDEVNSLKRQYKKGGLGDVTLKKFLAEILIKLIKPIRERRREFAADEKKLYEILKNGSENAEKKAAKTLKKIKSAIQLLTF